MLAQLLLQGAVILWLVQTAHTGGYGPASGVSNGHGPQPNGKKPQNGGGIGRMLMPSKGVGQAMGAQNGYGGYPTKGIGYGAAGSTNKGGTKGYGATAGVINGQGGKPQGYGAQAGGYDGQGTKGNGYGAAAAAHKGLGTKGNGYGVQAGPTNGQQMKGNGYGAQAGGYGGQGTKGYGAAAAAHKGLGTKGNGGNPAILPIGNGGYGVQAGPTNGQQMKGNGHGVAAAAHKGPGTKGNGQGAAVWPSSSKGPRPNGQEEAGSKPMKGYGRPPYGAGPGVGMGASRGLGVPQLARNQAYGRNGHNGYGAQPMGGYNGGYGSAGLGLGPRYRNGGMKGPKQGYGNIPSGYGSKPNGNGATRGGAMRPQPGYGNGAVPNGYGAKPNGYGAAAGAGAGVPNIYGTKPNGNGITNGAALGGYGNKLNGYGVTAGVSNGQLAANTDYGMIPNEKGMKGAGVSYEKGLKGGVLSSEQTSATPEEGVVPQQAITRGAAPVAPEPTSGILVMVTQEKYQKLPSPVPQGKSYKQTPLIPQATPEPAPAIPQARDPMPAPELTPEPAPIGPQGKGPKAATSGPAPDVPQTIPAQEPAVVLPQENGGGPSISKGQGAKAAKPDCRPSGVPNGQWMKIPRPGYNEGAGASTGTNTKGKDASKGGLTNGGGAKASKPGYEAGGYAVPGLSNGYGDGLGYPYTGKPQQPGYQGAYLGAGYGHSYGGNTGLGETSKSKSGNGNGYSAGVQPDYASFGQGGSAANGKSGGARQIPYNGAPVVPVGLDGVSQFEPQSAGLAPNGKLSSMYGGMGDLPFGGQPLGMGSEKLNTKYGIGGLQFGGQPLSTGTNGAGHYGYGGSPYGDSKSSRKYGYGGFPTGGLLLGLGKNGNTAGKYGYGRMPYEAQPAGLGPEAKSTGTYDLAGSPYQPEPLGLAQNGKYGGGDVPYAPQALGFGSEAKSSGIYDNHGRFQSQPLESVSEGRAGGEFDTAGLPYDPLPLEPDTAGKSYVKGEVPTPAIEVEGEGMPIDRYNNVGYINGQVKPEVVAFPAAPTHSSSLAYPSVPSYLPVESSFTPDVVLEAGGEDLSDPTGTARLAFDSAPATERQGGAQVPEEPDDLLQQQLPRQIHIQQHLKLHFHQQDKSGRGAKNGKYDVNGFFGNSGYQG